MSPSKTQSIAYISTSEFEDNQICKPILNPISVFDSFSEADVENLQRWVRNLREASQSRTPEPVESLIDSVNCHTIQNPNGHQQDFTCVFTGLLNSEGESFNAMFTFDGHGDSTVINIIRRMPLRNIAQMENPSFEIFRRLKEVSAKCSLYNSGSTYILTRVYENRIVINYCGDSEAHVFINDGLVYSTVPHNSTNSAEFARLKKRDPRVMLTPAYTLDVRGEKTIRMKRTNNIMHYDSITSYKLSPSMALGHNEITGYDFVNGEYGVLPDHTIEIRPGDKVKVIQGSDGVWDMLNRYDPNDLMELLQMNSTQIVERMVQRWKQEWKYEKEDGTYIMTAIGDDIDDVCCAVFERK